MSATPRVLLLMPKSTYRAEDFLAAARRAGIEARVGSDVCHVLHGHWATGALVVDFDRPERGAEAVVRACEREPVDAVVAATDGAAVVAALACERLGLPGNAPAAAGAAHNKRLLRQRLAAEAVAQPDFVLARLDDDPAALAARVDYPRVLKPVLLSASRGVIRADDPAQLVAAFERIGRLMHSAELFAIEDPDKETLLVERFVPGPEVALEGLLSDGELQTLALFDKPDPMEGPFFAETLYVTPSRLPPAVQERIRATTEQAARALGLRTGPVHAELRLPSLEAPTVIELAARSIGGLCGRALRFALSDAPDEHSLEELVLRHAVGQDVRRSASAGYASGVMMISPPRSGVLEAVEGLDEARGTEGIEDVVVGTPQGSKLVAPPEGGDYLGFVFARASTPATVESALRSAYARLRFRIGRSLT